MFFHAGDENLDFSGTSFSTGSSSFPGSAGCEGSAASLERSFFPQCWERDRVDLARVSAKIGLPHGILCNTAFEHGLEMSVDEVRAAARLLVASEPVDEEVSTQAAPAPSRDLRARSGEEEKSLEKKWSPPQKSVKEVFVKSLKGKLLLFSFTEEDTVLVLRNRFAMACKVSVNQFVLVFQSRTLQSSVKVESTGVQRGHTFEMQGALKEGMQRQGLMGEWDCTQCGAARVWPARTSCFRCGFKKDGSGTLPRCSKAFEKVKIILCHRLGLFVVQEMGWEGLNGIKARGVLQLVLLRLNLGRLISTIRRGGTNRKSHCLDLILCRRLHRLSSFCKVCPCIRV